MAIDPDTGETLECSDIKSRDPVEIIRGKTAKEVGIQITEGNGPYLISKLDHALYLGRELQKAEQCLLEGKPYIQD